MRLSSPILLLTVVFALACEQATTSPPEQAALPEPAAISAAVTAGAAMNQDLAALRRATAAFHNFHKAMAAGYDDDLGLPCLETADGAQGFHYGNTALFDGVVSLLEPEVLQYEPKAGGGLRLVGVEYLAFTDTQPADLLGGEFHLEDIDLWALHVWIWRQNPSGMFADWNPKVSC